MYYLRKKPYQITVQENEDTFMADDRAVYKHRSCGRFYRKEFLGFSDGYANLKLYTCKTLRKILEVRQETFNYSGEWFDVYDENGIVHGWWEE